MRTQRNSIRYISLLVTAIVCLFQMPAQAQLYYELTKDVPANTPFKEVQKLVNTHFDNQQLQNRDYMQWKRYEWLAKRRLNNEGILEDVVDRNKQGLQVKQQLNASLGGNTLNATHVSWIGLGPTGTDNADGNMGRVVCIAFHPSDANTWYIGTPAGGMWRTTNNGSSYTPLTDNLPGLGVASIVIHPSNPNTMYTLTGDGNAMNRGHYLKERGTGVYKTTDGGQRWDSTGYQQCGTYVCSR